MREQDYSQAMLVFGLPFYIFLGGLSFIWLTRRLLDIPRGAWGVWTKTGVTMVFVVSATIFLYIGFWFYKTWQVKKYKN